LHRQELTAEQGEGQVKVEASSARKTIEDTTGFSLDADSESGSSTENDSQQNSPINNEKCQRTGYPSGYQSEEL
jgi:hypothetical protein